MSEKLTKEKKELLEKKQKALEATLKVINKKHGAETINLMGKMKAMNIEAISTGSINLDKAIGVGGLPKGRVVEIYGPESSGKTTFALHCIANAQKAGGLCGFIDVEQALDLTYARSLGVNDEDLVISQPDNGETALDIVETLVESGTMDVVVIDSVAALTTQAEIDGEVGDQHVGQLARLMSKSLKKIIAKAKKNNVLLIYINQIRDNIGVVGYGEKTTTSGGKALKFYASVRLDIRRISTYKVKEEAVGNKVKVTVKKNKVAPPFRVAELDIMFGEGVSEHREVFDMAVKADIIDKAGAWFSYGDSKVGQGKDNSIDFLKQNLDVYEEIKTKVLDLDKELEVDNSLDNKDDDDGSV